MEDLNKQMELKYHIEERKTRYSISLDDLEGKPPSCKAHQKMFEGFFSQILFIYRILMTEVMCVV